MKSPARIAPPSDSHVTMRAVPRRKGSMWNRFGDLALIALVICCFGRLVNADFVTWDDNQTIGGNPWLIRHSLRDALAIYWNGGWHLSKLGIPSPAGEYGLYIPVTYTAWALLAPLARLGEADASGNLLNPLVFHAANIAVHLAAVLIVRRILLLLFRDARAAFFGAALFAVHPLQVEPVAWASGMKDVLSTALALAALLAYLRGASALAKRDELAGASPTIDVPDRPTRFPRATIYGVAPVVFAIAMLAKPGCMMLPLIAAIIDGAIVRRPIRAVARSIWPMLVVAAPLALIARAVQHEPWDLPVTPALLRPAIVLDSIAFYLGKLFVPARLTFDYARSTDWLRHSGLLWATWIVPAIAAAFAWKIRRRTPAVVAGLAIFVIAPASTLGFASFMFQFYSNVADHYLYLAMLGPAIAVAWCATRAAPQAVSPHIGRFLLAFTGVLAILCFQTFRQTRWWLDDESLARHGIDVAPQSAAHHNNLAVAFDRASNFYDAGEQYRIATELRPNWALPLINLARNRVLTGHPREAAELIERWIALVETFPRDMWPAELPEQRNRLAILRKAVEAASSRPAPSTSNATAPAASRPS